MSEDIWFQAIGCLINLLGATKFLLRDPNDVGASAQRPQIKASWLLEVCAVIDMDVVYCVASKLYVLGVLC